MKDHSYMLPNCNVNVENGKILVIVLIPQTKLKFTKINTSVLVLSKITNIGLLSFHFHALLVRMRGEMGPQDHLEVGVKARRQLYVLNRLEKRHQIEESSVRTFSSTDATVINDSYAVVAVVIMIVVVVGCSDVTVWDDLAVCAAVVVGIGAGARARVAGTTGSRTTHRSVIDTDKMRFNTMSGDERNIRHDTMITKHQLTRTTACTEDRRKCYKDKFTYLVSAEICRSLLKCEVINYCKVMIYHQIWQWINKSWHIITIDGSKSHNVVSKLHKSITFLKISFDISYLTFKWFCFRNLFLGL